MNYSSSQRGFPAGNPIANALVIIVGALAIAASIVLGFVAFVILASLMLISAAVIGIRLWWFRRKLRKAQGGAAGRPADSQQIIEGEYHVIIEERKERR